MSERPSAARDTGIAAKDQAWQSVGSAQEAWATAMRAHELASPDAEFRERLRRLSDAAKAMHEAHAQALEAGLAWRPIKGSEHALPPYELRPGTGRRGPHDLWAQFDNAVVQLNEAGASDRLADVVAAYAAVSHAAHALAGALDAGGS